MNKLNESSVMEIAKFSHDKMKAYFDKLHEPFHFRQYFPAYMDFVPIEMDFSDINIILDLEDIKWWKERKGFYGYFIDLKNKKTVGIALVALFNYVPEYYGCTKSHCLGYITKGNDGWPNLPWAKYAVHKPMCKYRLYKSIENDLTPLSKEERTNMLKEIGLETDVWREDILCDCGLMKLK